MEQYRWGAYGVFFLSQQPGRAIQCGNERPRGIPRLPVVPQAEISNREPLSPYCSPWICPKSMRKSTYSSMLPRYDVLLEAVIAKCPSLQHIVLVGRPLVPLATVGGSTKPFPSPSEAAELSGNNPAMVTGMISKLDAMFMSTWSFLSLWFPNGFLGALCVSHSILILSCIFVCENPFWEP